MNEQALQDAYNLFVSNGYQKSIDDFKKLITANPDALNDSYNLFKSQGYNKSVDDYKNLLGVSPIQPNFKKKADTALPSEDGSLVLPKIEPQRPAAESTAVKSIAPIPTVKKEKKEEVGTALNVIGALNKGVYNFFGQGVKGLGTALQGATAKITGSDGRGFISDALINVGDRYLKAIEELNPQDEEFKGTLTDQFSQALGQVGAAVLTGGLSRGAAAASAIQAAPKAVTLGTAAKQLVSGVASPTGAISALGMGQSEFERAKQSGATDEQAFESFYKNAITGSVLETIPVMQFFKRFNQASAGGVVNYLKTKAVGGITGGIEEMTTEVLQQLYANKTAQDIYNTNQDLFEGVGESGGIGFGVGFLLNAMGAQAKLLRKEGKVEEANVIETQMQEFEVKQNQEDTPAPAPLPVYKMKGVPIVTKEVIENIIDNAPVPEIINLGIEIDNDTELSNKLQKRIVTNSIKEQVKEGNPDLNEPSLNAITDLELQLKKLEGNTTQTGKDKAAAIRGQIKNIQENQLQEEAITETTKTEQDAIQEQATNESVLRTEQPELGLQEVVEGNQGLQVAATATQEIAPEGGTQEVVKTKAELFFDDADVLFSNDDIRGGYAVTDESGTQIGRVKMSEVNDNVVKIDEVVSEKRGQRTGNGSAIMRMVTDNADKNNVTLTLTPNLIGELKAKGFETPQKLKKFYEKFGFVNDAGRATMTRTPVAQAAVPEVSSKTPEVSVQEIMQQINTLEKENVSLTSKALKQMPNSSVQLKTRARINEINNQITTLKTQKNEQVQSKRTGDGGGRTDSRKIAPLKGAPSVKGINGPDPQLVAVAEDYAAKNGIDLKRQSEYVEVDEDRAKRIADAYEQMANDPQNPKVKEAYQELIKQTIAQYQALVDAGYKFWFMDLNISNNVEYASSPYNALRDMRENKEMGVFPTTDGYGASGLSELDVENNPLLADTGIQWPVGGLDGEMKNVLANDLFRAVHDAFGHGLEGSGFRARGEENAWQAHVRLFTGPAIAALTSETRGQNSWLNYGPNGETNKTAKVEDTVFAEQKVGLMPEFTWTEGLAGNTEPAVVAEPTLVIEEEEQFQPISIKDIKSDAFTKDNAIDYYEDERETDSGRMSTYLSSITVQVTNADGDEIGTITKITDADKIFYFTAEDINGNEINLDGFDTLGDAKKAIADSYNKVQKKEFEKETKRKAKEKTKKEAKKAKKSSVVTPTPQQEAPTPAVKAEPLAEDLSSIDALLDLDVEDEDNMLKVLNALDNLDKKINKRLFGGANESLLAIPLGTVQLVVKTLKALVKGGMILRDAIKKVATDNNLSQNIIKDIINISPIQEDFNALMSKVDALITRQKKRGIEDAKIVNNLDTFIRNSEAYKNANDAQKKIMEREGRIKMGAEERRAPSIGRILGVLKDITNVSRQDKLKIISQIRQLSKDAAKDLAKEIRELASTGKITVNQAANVIARFGKVNMLSEISVSSFVDYMTKVFADAEYASKLSAAKNLKSSIASLSKNKEKNADLRELAKQFIEIDPSMVDDIDAYNDMASKIKEAVSGSSIKTQNVNLARTVDIENALEYVSKTLSVQDKKMREEKAAEIQQLMGIDVSEFSYDEMVELLKKDKPISKYNEGIVRSTINKMFNVFSAMISENIKSGEDPITGDKVDYTKEQKRIISEFMDMDLSLLEPKQALESVDALANFLQNKSTAKMGAMLAEYKGITGAQTAVKDNLKAQTLKKYGLEWLGKLFAENTTNLNVLFERMFKGFNKGNIIQKLMGIRDVINNKAAAQKESNNKVEDYVKKFYTKLANKEAFNTAYNNVERGISSFMQRTIIGSESQRREFFNTRKKLVKQSIEVLSQGNDKEKEKAKLYQQAYDKLIGQTKGPNENQILENEAGSIEDIRRRTDATNLDAINYWQNSWSEKYDQLYNTALNIYNKVLGRDINYTPDRYSKLSSDTGKVELANDQSAFLNNNDVLYQKESGVLIESKRPDNLPKNRYLDFSFDNNNANSYYEALIDIATAEPIRQVQGFLNSPLYKKVVPNSDDATILKDRIQLFINNFRNKNPYDNDEFSKFVRSLNVLSEIGASMALGGVTQPLKQVIPVAVNTLVNAGGLDLSAPFDKAKNDFMSNSGYAIGNRGIESEAQVQSMNKLVEEAAKSSPERLLNLIKKGNQLYLKFFLVNADAYIARASWMTYYEKYLNDKGIDTKGIDYNTHELNKDAADYAQSMVDRQQNVSDADLAGKIFASKAPAVQLLVKTVMPFASFRMNQASRVGSDIAVVTDKTATKEDKTIAIRSLMGYAAETVTFRLISGYIAYQLGTAALKLLDREESEEEKEKRKNNLIKGQVTGTVTDVLSPAPIADKFVQSKVNDLAGAVQTGMNIPLEKQYNIFGESKQDYVQNMGMYGIASERASQLFEISKLAATGKYTDDFGKEKTISEKDQETLKPFIGLGFLSSIGLAPSEVGSVLRYMVKAAKKSPGKTEEEIQETEERLEEKQENVDQKLEALDILRKKTRFKKELDVIDEKIDELEATPEEKKVMSEERKEERRLKKELLTDPKTGVEYDNETELKRYNPRLYNKNFGLRSQWFKEHKDEKKVEKKLNKEIQKIEDKNFKYVRRNSDGTIKRNN